jgi:MFS family permease
MDLGNTMDVERRTIAKLKPRILPLCIAAAIICFMDRVNIAFAAPTMMKDLGFTATVYGFGAGVLFLTYILCEVPSNVMLSKVGARIWIARIMISWGIISAGMAFIVGPYSYFALRLLLGAAEAGLFPGILFYLSLWFPAFYLGRATSLFYLALPLANVVGAPMSGPILNLDGLLGLHGWQWLFLVEGVPPIILGAIFLAYLPDTPEKASWLAEDEREWLIRRLEVDRKATDIGHQSVWQALSNWKVIGLGIVVIAVNCTNYGLGFFLPLILKGFGLGNIGTGLVAAIPFVMGSLAAYICGKTSDYLKERKFHVAGSMAMAGIFLGLSVGFTSPVMQMVMISIAGFGMYAYLGPYWAMAISYIRGAGAAGAATSLALINSIGNLGGFASPYAIGYIKDVTNSFAGGIMAIAAVSMTGAVLTVLLGFVLDRSVRLVAPGAETRTARG